MTLKRKPVRKMSRAKGMKNIPKQLSAQGKAQIAHYEAQQKKKTKKAAKEYDDAVKRSKSLVLKPRKSGAKAKAKHHLGVGKPKPTSLVLKPRSSGAGPKAKHHKGVKKGRRKSAMDIMSGAKKSA